MLDAVRAAGRLDEADHALHRARRVVLEAESEREVEQHLRVGRALDLGVERRVDREREIALDLWKPSMKPLCIHSQRPCRNGWQLVCCTGEPVEARMCAKTSGDEMWPESSCRLRSFQAGSMLRKTPGVSCSPYQPTPKPSPLVVSAPSCEWRLWTISECFGL